MNNNSVNNQDIFLRNRSELNIGDIKKIITLNENLFDIDTGYGRLKIEGKNLEMISLDNDKCILIIKGKIDKLEFMEKSKKNKETSFIAKIFK